MSKKIVSIGVSLTTAVWLSGAATLVPVASGQAVAELQAQIATMLAQIQKLQAQLTALRADAPAVVTCVFDRALFLGSRGDDVKCLQQYLNAAGHTLAATGPGSPGNETTYFGSLTKAAVAKWQAANNVSPAVGYFGPISRAKYSELVAVVVAPVVVAPVVVAPVVADPVVAAGLSVSLAADSPTGSVISGSLQIDAAKYVISARENATITGLKFRKIGVVSDAHLVNLYLAEAGSVIAQYSSLSRGVVSFDNLSIGLKANESRTLTLRVDLSSAATAGNTLSWQLTDVSVAGVEVTGLPVSSNVLTVTTVDAPALSSVALSLAPVGTPVDAGTTNVPVFSANAAVTNSPAELRNIKFTVTGSANFADLRNVKLLINGVQAGGIISAVPADGRLIFDLSASPVRLSTGISTIDVRADILGSPHRTFTFQILRPFDVLFIDTEYNSGIASDSRLTVAGTEITVRRGEITITAATDTPAHDIARGTSNVVLAKFNFYAAGEAVRVNFIDLRLAKTGGDVWGTLANVTRNIGNIRIIDDAGRQLGSTISIVAGGTGSGQCSLAADAITCHFGTTGSHINYLIPANTTRVLSVIADIKSTADISAITASFGVMTADNLEGQTSFQRSRSGTASGRSLAVIAAALTVARNTGFGNPTYVRGAANKRIASFKVTASSAEGASISAIKVDKDLNPHIDLQNLRIVVAGTQFGSTKGTVGDVVTAHSFSGGPVIVSAGTALDIDVYADILSTSATGTQVSVIDLIGWSAIGSVSRSSIGFPIAAGVDGQNVIVVSAGTLTVEAASGTAVAQNLVMGSTNNSLFTINLRADDNEDIEVRRISFTNIIVDGAAGMPSFSALSLYDGAIRIAGPLGLTLNAAGTLGTVEFSLVTPITVAKGATRTIELRGNVASRIAGSAVSGSGHTFRIVAAADVTAIGRDSKIAVGVFGTPATANQMRVYRTNLTLASAREGVAIARVRRTLDNIARISFTADSADRLQIRSVRITFAGIALPPTLFNVVLIDPVAMSAWGGSGTGQASAVTTSVNFAGINHWISAGGTANVILRVDSSGFANPGAGTESLSVTINAVGDVVWNDGTTASINLEARVVPFSVVDVTYE